MTERKLATIEEIKEVITHENADSIDIYVVKGWRVIGKRGEYKVGDKVLYLEVDSWVPQEVAPFLCKNPVREFKGIQGERLRTARLRGELSQGLILAIPENLKNLDVGTCVSEELNITKYEHELPANLGGVAKGTFPVFLKKTDQERIQNLSWFMPKIRQDEYQITEKLDGSSMTVYYKEDGEYGESGSWGVCSRNLDLKLDQEGNSFVNLFNSKWDNFNKLKGLLHSRGIFEFAIQGELCGPGIQKNSYKLNAPDLFTFDIFDIKTGEYIDPQLTESLVEEAEIKHTPVYKEMIDISNFEISDFLEFAEGQSVLAKTAREGVVFKCLTRNFSFKVISNKWLLKNE